MKETNTSVTEQDVLYEIRTKLYPNYLPKVEGKYVARTNSRRSMSIEEVCMTLKRRTSYEGDYNTTVKAVKAYFEELVYQVCNGSTVNTGYFSIHANIGGIFNSQRDIHDREKNPISFRTRFLSRMNRLIRFIKVEIEGMADTNGFIDEFFDGRTKSTNDSISSNDVFSITGEKIKVVSDEENTDCGVFFVKSDDPSVRLKVNSYLIENTSTKINGITPTLFTPASYRIEIVTQYNGSSQGFLKHPRTIASDFELTIDQIGRFNVI